MILFVFKIVVILTIARRKRSFRINSIDEQLSIPYTYTLCIVLYYNRSSSAGVRDMTNA